MILMMMMLMMMMVVDYGEGGYGDNIVVVAVVDML